MVEKSKEEIVISMPLYLVLSKKEKGKKYHLNLNQYRNWHYLVSNNLKKKYKEIVYPKIKDFNFDKISLKFILYKSSKRKIDRANVLCVHEKFFCDALVESGCILDDNDTYIESTSYFSGGIDRSNPRVEIHITEL